MFPDYEYLNVFYKIHDGVCDPLLSFDFRIGILLVMALFYAVFDVFNKRNVPNYFVYAWLIIGLAITFTYNLQTIYISLIVLAVVLLSGYLLYRKGVLGGGDFLEIAAISMILPIQPAPLLSRIPQFGFPFVLSVFICAGYAAVVGMLLYYLVSFTRSGRKITLERNRLFMSVFIFVLYVIFLAMLSRVTGVNVVEIVLVLLIAAASSLTIAFEKSMNSMMVSYMYPSKLTEDDMIATNFMSKSDLQYFKRRSRDFGRLVTKNVLKNIKGVKKKLPVYTSGVPLALFVLIGVVISLLFGNIILYLIV